MFLNILPDDQKALKKLILLMFKILNKVGELLAPQPPNEYDEFKKDCTKVIDVLKSQAVDESSKLKPALTNIATGLLQEVEKGAYLRFDYFIQQKILSKIANQVTPKLPSEQLEPVLKFFLFFINSDLNTQLAQVSIHEPITHILSMLESLDHKCPKETREFAVDVWSTCRKKPILLEIMSIQKGDKITFPLLDYFCSASMTLTEIGLKSRDFLIYLFIKNECNKEEQMPASFGKYVCQNIYPQFTEFLKTVSGYVSTIQFNGSMTTTLQWMDNFFLIAGGYSISEVILSLSSLPVFKENLAISFYLSFFTSKDVKSEVLKYSIEREQIEKIIVCLKSKNSTDQKSSLVLIKTLLTLPETYESIFPQVSESPSDILSLIPVNWLLHSEGNSSTEAYVADAANRLSIYGSRPKVDNESLKNNLIFPELLSLFRRFPSLTVHVCLELTSLLATFMAIAPDLINTEFADAFKSVVALYNDVDGFTSDIDKQSSDSPQIRAAILAEFGKEIHGTFIAAEKLSSLNSISEES